MHLPAVRTLTSDQVYYSRGTSVKVDFVSHESVERSGFLLQYQKGIQFFCLQNVVYDVADYYLQSCSTIERYIAVLGY